MKNIRKISPTAFHIPKSADDKELKLSLARKVRRAGELSIPTVILLEGWGGSGKGYMIEQLTRELDPRGFKVYSIGDATEEEKRYPMLKRFLEKLPAYGEVAIFDRSWYREVSISRVEEKISDKLLDRHFADIHECERQLTADGYLIVKIFLHISKDKQKNRFEKLASDPATAWRVTENDRKRHKHYEEYETAFAEMIARSDESFAPWIVLDASDKKDTAKEILYLVSERLDKAIAEKEQKLADEAFCRREDAIDYSLAEKGIAQPIPSDIRVDPATPLVPIKPLCEYDLSLSVDDATYKKRLKELQKELFELHNALYRKKIPLIIAFEGWDAAGKGGAIKRLTAGLDPRGYEVLPISAPTKPEITRQFLWRFWKRLPKSGHIGIFDRSWYGRVMVERLEGFARREEWTRAYDEINHFEASLVESGAIVLKFWLHIDSDEQLKRFEARQNDPEKQWKITDEDWRNREKATGYHVAVDQMLALTNTPYAPWYVIEANNKKFARLKVLESVITEIRKNIDK